MLLGTISLSFIVIQVLGDKYKVIHRHDIHTLQSAHIYCQGKFTANIYIQSIYRLKYMCIYKKYFHSMQCVLSLTPSPFSIKHVYRTPGDPLPWNGVYIDRCTCRHTYIYICWPKNAVTWSILSHVKPSCYRCTVLCVVFSVR